jgi:hypothetical protein
MKQLFIIIWAFSSHLLAGSISHEEIISMISKIKEERKGIALSTLDGTKNPFLIKSKTSKKAKEPQKEKVVIQALKEESYLLEAILNHAAFINRKWYKKGDKVGEYHVTYVGSVSVNLESEGSRKTLSLPSKKKNFIKLKKGYN